MLTVLKKETDVQGTNVFFWEWYSAWTAASLTDAEEKFSTISTFWVLFNSMFNRDGLKYKDSVYKYRSTVAGSQSWSSCPFPSISLSQNYIWACFRLAPFPKEYLHDYSCRTTNCSVKISFWLPGNWLHIMKLYLKLALTVLEAFKVNLYLHLNIFSSQFTTIAYCSLIKNFYTYISTSQKNLRFIRQIICYMSYYVSKTIDLVSK